MDFLSNCTEQEFEQIITVLRARYDQQFYKLHGKIQFVGMSVYKEEAIGAVAMERIYIPLKVIGEGSDDADLQTVRIDPATLLIPGERHVILGDPGSGKSTMLKFLALIGIHDQLRDRFGLSANKRLPILIILRQYIDKLKTEPSLNLLDYIVQITVRDFELFDVDREFFEYYLCAGQAILLFDGIDELPGESFKLKVREDIAEFIRKYPGNTVIISSRIVGYEARMRYDTLGFFHHRVARLKPEDIQEFINNWYLVRIENTFERLRHVNDLTAIIRDPDSRAIRELAENPLLLTIICLVHRIDAVLPDERVVLYQKCTETLLNTWHTWKYRSGDQRQRGRIEKQNRARMEAIAYWLHSAFDEANPEVRAIVDYRDLLDFLVEYITHIERPRAGEARELAVLFLRFVRERIGLLIEVGEAKYSFVHLTFQEYLAATYLRKSGEIGGIDVIWRFLEKHCGSPRWHEVMRLLIGALEQQESQRRLLTYILPAEGDKDFLARAVLAGGCLLDSVAVTDVMQEQILRTLLLATLSTNSLDALRKPLRQLRLWQDRSPAHKQQIGTIAHGIINAREDERVPVILALHLISLGWSNAELRASALYPLNLNGNYTRQFAILFGETVATMTPLYPQERELLLAIQCTTGLSSPWGNLDGVILSAVENGLAVERPCFELLLCSVQYLHGPFLDLFRIVMLLGMVAFADTRFTNKSLALTQTRFLSGGRDRVLALALARVRDPDLFQTRDRALNQARELAQAKARELTRELARELDRDLEMDPEQAAKFWTKFLGQAEFHAPVLELVCRILALQPQPPWWEALRLRWLPQVPKRLTLADPAVWRRTLLAFKSGSANASDYRQAASQLLLDVGLWLTGYLASPDESPFVELAELTRNSASVPLNISHCLRDLAYGRAERADDLVAMARSTEYEYASVFRNAFWRD